MRALVVLLVLATLAGCAAAGPAPAPPLAPTGAPLNGVRRVVVVPSGESRFAVTQESRAPDRVFEDVLKWLPYKDVLVPIAQAVYWGVSWLMENERKSETVPRDVTPGSVVAATFARTLRQTGAFESIVAMDQEPVGEARRDTDAIVRLTVPAWGLVRVQDGSPALVAGFADVRAQLVVRETGAVVWEHAEDVTHPDRHALDALKKDKALARDGLVDVLERAGRRLASEFIYARSGGS
jgi:predicted small lipoprotein YifL